MLSSSIKYSSFKDIKSNFQKELDSIDIIIKNTTNSKNSLAIDVVHNLIFSGGKRLRPILAMLAYQLHTKKPINNELLDLATSIELLHNATLLHDDVIDDGHTRHGNKTANKIWGNKASILVGDFLISSAFELIAEAKNLEAISILAKAVKIISDSEIKQLSISNNIELNEEEYFDIIQCKTAELFAASMEIGGILAGESDARNCRELGILFGIIFQIYDDVLDYSSNGDLLGKDIGNDFKEKKVTLPLILTYKHASNDEKQLIKTAFESGDDFDFVLSMIKKYDSINCSIDISGKYRDKFMDILGEFNESNAKDMLCFLIDYCVERKL